MAEFERCLLEKGVEIDSCSAAAEAHLQDYDWPDNYYKYIYNGQTYSIYVVGTKYSDQVRYVNLRLNAETYAEKENDFYKLIGRVAIETDLPIIRRNKELGIVTFGNDYGEVTVSNDPFDVNIIFQDKENWLLDLAEGHTTYDKSECKRLQKKYNNPLFYDKNPRFR